MISYWKNPILHKFCSYRTILILSAVSSVGNKHICSANKGAKSFVSLPSPCHPLSSTPPVKILFCALSLWSEYYSLLHDLESACLSPDWAEAAEQLWKQWRSWGKLWLVGEAGEIWDPPGPVPMSAHKPAECGCHKGRLSHSSPSPKLGLPITGVALAFCHPFFRKRTFFLLFPPWPQDGSINIVLLGSPEASFHPGSQEILSRQIHRSELAASVVHIASSPLWPQLSPPEVPWHLLCTVDCSAVKFRDPLYATFTSVVESLTLQAVHAKCLT